MTIKSLTLAWLIGVSCFTACAQSVTLNSEKRFESDIKRDPTAKPDEIIAFAGVTKGMVVADIFGGGGYYAELLSEVVGNKGQVFLHNNEGFLRFFGKELKARIADNRLPNVVDHQSEADELGFKSNSLDAIFFVLGYHDLFRKSKDWNIDETDFMKQLTKALKKGGTLLLIDHSAPADSDTKYTQKLHRIGEKFVIQEIKKLGYELVKTGDMLRNSQDSRRISPFRPDIRRKTDRFVLLFKKS